MLSLDTRKSLVLLALALFCALTMPRLMSHGMFFDGATYAALARNMAIGIGSFWKPHYTDVIFPQCYEHPPLGFFMQSLAFRIFGDSVRVEAFYGFIMGLITIVLMAALWKKLDLQNKVGAWFPIILFCVFPVTSWIFANNLMENTMTAFTTGAVLAAVAGITAKSRGMQIAYGALSGLLAAAAMLVKGPVGMFPIIAPLAVALILREIPMRRGITVFLSGMICCIAVFALLCLRSDALTFFNKYLQNQIFASILGQRQPQGSRLFIIKRLAQEAIVPLAAGAILHVFLRKKAKLAPDRRFTFLLFTAISASLPLALSLKQYWWYIFPSLPFYAMAFAAMFSQSARIIEDEIASGATLRKVVQLAAIWILIVAAIIMVADRNTVRKAHRFHEDFTIQPLQIPFGEKISVCPAELETDWELAANFARQFGATLTKEWGHKYLLVPVGAQCEIPQLYRKYHPPVPKRYVIYELSAVGY